MAVPVKYFGIKLAQSLLTIVQILTIVQSLLTIVQIVQLYCSILQSYHFDSITDHFEQKSSKD